MGAGVSQAEFVILAVRNADEGKNRNRKTSFLFPPAQREVVVNYSLNIRLEFKILEGPIEIMGDRTFS